MLLAACLSIDCIKVWIEVGLWEIEIGYVDGGSSVGSLIGSLVGLCWDCDWVGMKSACSSIDSIIVWIEVGLW